jgi:hypothetical protein
LLCLVVLGEGCAKKAVAPFSAQRVDEASKRGYAVSMVAGSRTVFAASRYLAVRHKFVVMTVGSEVARSLEAVIAFCGTIQCEVVSSNVTNETADSTPSGSLSVRVKPSDVDKLTAFVGKRGKIAQHTTETEDKTTVVVDADARIKNLTEFRDTLRKMLGRPATSVADLVQIQEKLADAQSQLDSEEAQRKILANETEKVALEIDFRAERTAVSTSALKPIGDAVRESASVLAESLASLITAVVAILPWLIVIAPGGWLLVKTWRRVRRKGASVVTDSSTA